MPIHADKLLLDSFECLLDKYRKRLSACRRDMNEEAVHDLRTATRRLLSMIELFRALAPQSKLGKLRKILKTQLDNFDDLRDTQVMLLEIGNRLETLPELTHFKLHLQHREQRLLQQTQAFIESIDMGKTKRKLKRAYNRCKRLTAKHGDTNSAVFAIIDNVYVTAVSRLQAIDPTELHSIHHLRIAVKKLRYLLAATAPLLPSYSEQQTEQIKEYVTLMGDIQNSSVLSQTLQIYFVSGIPETIEQYFRQQQQELLGTFMLRKDEVLGFWRERRKDELPGEVGVGFNL